MSLLVVGSVAYDGITTPHGKCDRVLGGAGTYVSLSASFFTQVSLVGVVGDDETAKNIGLCGGRRSGRGKSQTKERKQDPTSDDTHRE